MFDTENRKKTETAQNAHEPSYRVAGPGRMKSEEGRARGVECCTTACAGPPQSAGGLAHADTECCIGSYDVPRCAVGGDWRPVRCIRCRLFAAPALARRCSSLCLPLRCGRFTLVPGPEAGCNTVFLTIAMSCKYRS